MTVAKRPPPKAPRDIEKPVTSGGGDPAMWMAIAVLLSLAVFVIYVVMFR